MTQSTLAFSATPEVFNFQSHAVRVFADDKGEPLFCAKDVCAILGYRNDTDAVKKHCREAGVAKRYLGVITGKTASGADAIQQIQMTFINEGNLYRLIVKSRKPEAERFEQLVMDEILPTIRKTGSYTLESSPDAEQRQQEQLTQWVQDQRWLLFFNNGKATMKAVEPDAALVPMSQWPEVIKELILPDDALLARIATACSSRLEARINYQKKLAEANKLAR